MIDFFPIETPYNSEDYKIMQAVVNKGIDSHLEGFTKSKFTKSPTFANKFLWNIHESELPILYRRLEELYSETGNEDYESFLNDVKHVAGTNKSAAAGTLEPELDEMLNPYDPMDANQTANGMPTSTSDLAETEFEMSEDELREMIRRELHSKSQGLASENDSDSLRNAHGENLKPATLGESTDTERYEQIVFMQGEEANEAMDILDNEGKDAAMIYLKQWHYPGEHEGRDEPGHGTSDRTYSKDGYIMSWNPHLPYIGLVYDTQYGQEATMEEDSQVKRHQAGQREKIGDMPLGQHAPHSQAAIRENKK